MNGIPSTWNSAWRREVLQECLLKGCKPAFYMSVPVAICTFRICPFLLPKMTLKIVLVDLFLVAKITFTLENWENMEKHKEDTCNHTFTSKITTVGVYMFPGVFFVFFFYANTFLKKIKWDHIVHADLCLHKYHFKSKLG